MRSGRISDGVMPYEADLAERALLTPTVVWVGRA